MNKPAMSAMRKQAQGGFTLIELIVVIVILGILAATALPKFANMGGDARIASLNAVRGALSTTASMMHGQFLMNPSGPFTNEGVTITNVNGYPAGDANTAAAAGLAAADYNIVVGTGAAATSSVPQVPTGSLLIQPVSVSTIAAGLTCYVMYTPAANSTTPPTVVVTHTNGCN